MRILPAQRYQSMYYESALNIFLYKYQRIWYLWQMVWSYLMAQDPQEAHGIPVLVQDT